MKCFNHQELDAVALCLNCLRGLCSACATEAGDGFACAGDCERRIAINVAHRGNYDSASRAFRFSRFIMPSFLLALGAMFLGLAIANEDSTWTSYVLGLIFLVCGVAQLLHNLKTIKPLTGLK